MDHMNTTYEPYFSPVFLFIAWNRPVTSRNLMSIISNSSHMLGISLCVLGNLYSYPVFSVFPFTVALNSCAFIDFSSIYSQFTLALLGRESCTQLLWCFGIFSNRCETKHYCHQFEINFARHYFFSHLLQMCMSYWRWLVLMIKKKKKPLINSPE